MIKFKENVYAFIYNSEIGGYEKIFYRELLDSEVELINEIISDDDVLITRESNINELFEFYSKEELDEDNEFLNFIFDWID